MKVRVTVDLWLDEDENLNLLAAYTRTSYEGVYGPAAIRDIDVEAL